MTLKKKHVGTDFDEFLEQESMLSDTTATAVKRVIAWQIEKEMKAHKLTKTELAQRMHTSRAAVNRLLDAGDTSLTLMTLAGVATALGKRLKIELVAG
jgi:antitoxin HicB